MFTISSSVCSGKSDRSREMSTLCSACTNYCWGIHILSSKGKLPWIVLNFKILTVINQKNIHFISHRSGRCVVSGWQTCPFCFAGYSRKSQFCKQAAKLAMLVRKVYIGNRKNISAKINLDWSFNQWMLLWYLSDWANLALLALLILSKSSKSKSQLVHQQKWS